MNDRENHAPRRAPRPDRAERLAEALRANLKRRKAQARGRADRGEPAGTGESQPNQPQSGNKDR
jgi:hypothetical protein